MWERVQNFHVKDLNLKTLNCLEENIKNSSMPSEYTRFLVNVIAQSKNKMSIN